MSRAKLNADQKTQIRDLARQGVKPAELARQFGVGLSAIYIALRSERRCLDCGVGVRHPRSRCASCERQALHRQRWLSSREAAMYLGVADVTLLALVRQGRVVRQEHNGLRGFRREDLDAYRATRARRTPGGEGPLILAHFDVARFYADLDRVREERGRSWNSLLRDCLLAESVPRRQKKNPSVNTIVVLALWGDLSLDAYIQREMEE